MKKTTIVLLLILTLLIVGCQSSVQTYKWCQAGSQWTFSDTTNNMNAVIVGIETTGKYAGYCHVVYDVESADNKANINMYFNQEGQGYQVIEVNGQTIESEWTG
ncbi:hypothetical protein ACFLZB_02720 [Nanoarchaeota archaeon]